MNDIADPILLEVINNALTAIGDEMGNTMKRTARSITGRAGDSSTVLVDARGRVIAQGRGAGFHLGYMRGVMPTLMRKFAGKLRPGDIIASNDPYGGLSHLPDIVLLAPIFWHDTMVGFSTLVIHHSDIGGRFPGGQSVVCAEIFEEGLRLPCVKLYEEGRRNEAMFELIAANVRTPDDVLGDLEGQAAACRRGILGVCDLIDKYGLGRFQSCVEQLQRYSERVVRDAIAAIPDGDYPYEEHFEEDGVGGPGVNLKLCVKIHGDSATVDFSGSGAQVRSAINVPYTLTGSAVHVCFRGALATQAPANEGLFAPIEVIAPLGCVFNPRFPAAIGGRGMMLWRICDMMFGALAKAMPERIFAAGEGGTSSITYAYSGAADGASPVLTDWYAGGWGARPTKDGIDGVHGMADLRHDVRGTGQGHAGAHIRRRRRRNFKYHLRLQRRRGRRISGADRLVRRRMGCAANQGRDRRRSWDGGGRRWRYGAGGAGRAGVSGPGRGRCADGRYGRRGQVSRRALALSHLPVPQGRTRAAAHLPLDHGTLWAGRRRRRYAVSGRA
jgi:N-methylhydantoinase B